MIRKLILIFFAMLAATAVLSIAAGGVVQTQGSDTWEGVAADLTNINIKNDVLTLRFKFRNEGENSPKLQIYFKDCYIVDESNQKKYFPLKDSEGLFVAGPKDRDLEGGRFRFVIEAGGFKGFWIKFPVPADDPETVVISIPGFFPFEDIPLK
ncbi:MAG TPA: hypothetical protein ENN40_00115 [Candidatus Aminicenantes bacterium]|nr:hypothetical protein [Candidatus Aminicenantes bacterium]